MVIIPNTDPDALNLTGNGFILVSGEINAYAEGEKRIKDRAHRIRLVEFDGEKVRKTDLSGYRYHLIGLVKFKSEGGQGDVGFNWTYLCRDAKGDPVLIREEYGISWWDGPGPDHVSRDNLFALTEEPLTQPQFL